MSARQHTGEGMKLVALLAIGTLASVSLRAMAEPPARDGGEAQQSSVGQAAEESARSDEAAPAAEAEEHDLREASVATVSPEGWTCSVPCVWTEMRVGIGDPTIAAELHQCIAEGRRVTVVIGASEGSGTAVVEQTAEQDTDAAFERDYLNTWGFTFLWPGEEGTPETELLPGRYEFDAGCFIYIGKPPMPLDEQAQTPVLEPYCHMDKKQAGYPCLGSCPEIPGQKLMGCNHTYDYPRPGVKVLTGCGCYYAEPAPKR